MSNLQKMSAKLKDETTLGYKNGLANPNPLNFSLNCSCCGPTRFGQWPLCLLKVSGGDANPSLRRRASRIRYASSISFCFSMNCRGSAVIFRPIMCAESSGFLSVSIPRLSLLVVCCGGDFFSLFLGHSCD